MVKRLGTNYSDINYDRTPVRSQMSQVNVGENQ